MVLVRRQCTEQRTATGKDSAWVQNQRPLNLRLLELRRLPKAILTLCRVFDSHSKQERRTQSLRPSRISFAQTLSPPLWPSPPSGRATRLPAFQTAPSCALRSAPSHPPGRLSGLDSINSFKRTRRMYVNYTLISLNYTWSILHINLQL